MENEYRNALLKGTLLEGYEIIRVLGCGTFGMTYLAKDTQLNMQVAIKEYLPSDLVVRQGSTILPKSTDSDMDFAYGLERFEQEAQTLVHCKHPNVVQVLRYLKANGTGYMVMNYEEGAPLDKILERNMQDGVRLTEEELTENILFPLLDALKQVHAAKFLHRDIKPGNIYMRRSDEMPILLDFGAARFALGEKSRNLSVVLTDGYAPFEQYYEDGNQGPWTDIYALAAVAYYIVSGNKPPVSAARISHDKMVPATEAGKGLFSHQLLEAIDHALAVNSEDRPQSCEEWAYELLNGQARSEQPYKQDEKITQNFTIVDEDKSDASNDVENDDTSREIQERLQEAQRKEDTIHQDDKPVVRFFSKLIHGDFGLAKTYWLYGVLVGFIVGILLLVLTSIELQVSITVLHFAYEIPVLIGTWRAAKCYEGRRLWAILAQIAVVLGALGNMLGLFDLMVLMANQ